MYKRILVPLDGSLRAETVLRHVEELAFRYEATVLLLRVVDIAAPVGAADQAYAGLQKRELDQETLLARDYLSPLAGQFREKGIEAHSIVAYGRAVDGILETATGEGVDLIAVSSHGRSGLSRVFFGSVATGLLQRTLCPVLVVPARDS
jgi:nucleotide-binding universal stress UspA family protein